MVDKGLLDAINRLRGVGGPAGGSAEKKETTQATPSTTSAVPQQPLSTGTPENMQDLSNFLNSSEAVPTQNIEKKYTMKDLDDFIESLVKPK